MATARAAFEYRDFAVVVASLDPWVHPPRIVDPERMAEARQLLGVALHVTGDVRGAKEEFAQLLLIDPKRRLDAFVIPPRVIATFEEVKRQLRPRLVRPIRPSPKVELGLDSARVVEVEVPHPALAFLPFGVPQVLLDEPELGVTLGALQAAGLAANLLGFFMADRSQHDDPNYGTWVFVQYAGLGTVAAAYGASVVQSQVAMGQRREAAQTAPEAFRITLPFDPLVSTSE